MVINGFKSAFLPFHIKQVYLRTVAAELERFVADPAAFLDSPAGNESTRTGTAGGAQEKGPSRGPATTRPRPGGAPSAASRASPHRAHDAVQLALMRRFALLFSALPLVIACGGNQYGHAPQYVPLSDEEPYMDKGVDETYEEVRRDPSSRQQELLAWFGVVEDVKGGASGPVTVALNL